MILEKSNHLILILKFTNQNQMIFSCDFKQIESFDSDLKKDWILKSTALVLKYMFLIQ